MTRTTITAATVEQVVARQHGEFCKRDITKAVHTTFTGGYTVEGNEERLAAHAPLLSIDGLVSRVVDQMVRCKALVRVGVRREYDAQSDLPGGIGAQASARFGGAGVMVRRRAYFRRAG